MEPSTRRSLVLRLRNSQDEAAWAEFMDVYEPLVYRLARTKGLQDPDARDLCQEVFRAVAGAVERWDPDPAKGRFRAWLFRIARNLLVKFLASQRRHPRGTGSSSIQELLEAQPEADPGAEAEFALEFQRRAFRWAAEQVKHEFTDSTWQAFWQTGVENRPIPVVAEALGLSPGAVYIARSRVLARLRDRVAQLTEDTGLDVGGNGDDLASASL
jgi:RNA polymerase sigma-70 factor (ECF subfamily)